MGVVRLLVRYVEGRWWINLMQPVTQRAIHAAFVNPNGNCYRQLPI